MRSQRIRVITKQRRFAAVGRRGMCCAPSSIRVSSWLLPPCSLSGDRSSAAPQGSPCTAVQALLATVLRDEGSKRQTDWAERDLALILTALLAGLRSEELRVADIGDIRTTDNRAATIHVRGKAARNAACRLRLNSYRSSRRTSIAAPSGFPAGTKRKAGDSTSALSRWPARSPLFVGRDGERITRGHCNHESSGPSSVLAPKRNQSQVPSFTGFGIPTRLNWPAPTSAYTRL